MTRYGNVIFDEDTGDVDYIEERGEREDEYDADETYERLGETEEEYEFWEEEAAKEDADILLIEKYMEEYYNDIV